MRIIQTFAFFSFLMSCTSQIEQELPFSNFPIYRGDDLGLTRNGDNYTLKVWSPYAKKMVLKLYRCENIKDYAEHYEMEPLENGIWEVKLSHTTKYCQYNVQIRTTQGVKKEVVDPYAKVVSINGERGVIAFPDQGDPEHWSSDSGPVYTSMTDMILYELHVRDFSMSEHSGHQAKGKFVAFTETGTETSQGTSTGLDHLIDLGITHVHLLPVFDYRSIDEYNLDEQNFNWGYEPLNYNAPEGSYATDPFDPINRIKEFKSMVMALHENGIGVIMDVVYNHTGLTGNSNFNQLVPDYYYRQAKDGTFSNASACGNETASERYMMRKFMFESLKFWASEYHIDGFRFDLMGIHDLETMNLISAELKAINPSIILYGEGWTAGPSPLPESQRALKANISKLQHVAAFSDDIRDGIKGSVFNDGETGFATGLASAKESIKFGIVAAIQHPQINYSEVNYSSKPWASTPEQCINYVSCHDNHTLWDKISLSRPEATQAEMIAMHKLANTIVLTSQGIPFLHGGVELLRTKHGDHNSYKSPDEVNSIKWEQKDEFPEVYQYYRSLIDLRKKHPAFRMSDPNEIRKKLVFMDEQDPHLLSYWLKGHANQDNWETIGVYFNGGSATIEVKVPDGKWMMVVGNGKADLNQTLEGGRFSITPYSAVIIHN